MNITSRQLRASLLTARHRSFSRAAEQLFITQSGMSVLIRELESTRNMSTDRRSGLRLRTLGALDPALRGTEQASR